jgi:DNA-binding response OmpR family regulator
MLIEDDEAIQDFLTFYFSEEGIATLRAWDVDEAIGLVDDCLERNALPCVILVDCNLSTANSGVQIIRHVRSAGVRIPVIAMSASHDTLSDAVVAGANFTVRKPFDIDHLKNLLVNLCASQAMK